MIYREPHHDSKDRYTQLAPNSIQEHVFVISHVYMHIIWVQRHTIFNIIRKLVLLTKLIANIDSFSIISIAKFILCSPKTVGLDNN